MAKPHGRTPDGRPANLIGQPLDVRPAPLPQPRIVTMGDTMTTKAPDTGVYILNGTRYRIRKGDALPEGAEFEGSGASDDESRALTGAPENKRKPAAPENRAEKGA